jgi:integrase/recombinase XerC
MEAEELAPSTALVIYVPEHLRGRAMVWQEKAGGDRRRDAARAASEHDVLALCELTIGYVFLVGRQHAAASDHTIESYCAGVRSLLKWWTYENLLHPSDAAGQRYMTQISRDHAAATCAARLTAAVMLYRALRWAAATTADPFAGVRPPINRTPKHERRRPYDDGKIDQIAAAADSRLRVLIYLCAHGGLRIAEAVALRWDEVNLTQGWLFVRDGKGGKARTVHLSTTLRRELTEWRALSQGTEPRLVLRSDGGPARDTTWLRRRLRLACERAGVEYLGWHAMRHTAGTRLARDTNNLQLVAAHLGHSDVSTTAIYAKWSDNALREAVLAW